jgi:3-methylfumaryl-CoA hydratase
MCWVCRDHFDDHDNCSQEPTLNMSELLQWVGKTEVRHDRVTETPVAALAAVLDRDDPPPQTNTPLPAFWHRLFFVPLQRQSQLGEDGHPKRGDFLPPVSLPRRMFASCSLTFFHPLRVGDHITRVSRIQEINHKEGRTGPLVFVKMRHEISNEDGLSVVEEQQVVYRNSAQPGGSKIPQAADTIATWSRDIRPDPVLLFRYSALTFNGHRIHYDRTYATEVEGYEGLLVQGPLIATLLLDLLRRSLPERDVASFSFRAVRPLFDNAPFLVCGREENGSGSNKVKLWAQDAGGSLCMDATAELR